ncbi:MAG: methyl-accepting chemotaxis protein, partial [Oligoflexales bacterium]|nr:methyl-accepting chemotaxis protein [Oligoflexales bacterium]
IRITVFVVFMVMLVLMISGIIQYWRSSANLKKQLDELLAMTTDRIEGSTIDPLFNGTPFTLESYVQSEMKEKRLIMVSVSFIEGDADAEIPFVNFVRDDKGNPLKLDQLPKTAAKGLMLASRELKKDGKLIGRLQVGMTTEYLRVELNQLVVSNLLTFLVVCGLLIAILLFSIRQVFIGHLHAIKNQVQMITRGDLNQMMSITTADEFYDIAHSVNTMTKGLKVKSDFAEAIANGDLSRDLSLTSDQDNLGLALLKMKEGLRLLIGRITDSSENVSKTSETLAKINHKLSMGTSDSAASITEISTSLKEIDSQLRDNAAYVHKVSDAAKRMKSNADLGNQRMKQMKIAIENISSSSARIANIIKSIDTIAFQTNLLALNAAVEAAHAGAHGRGFAVVADEVRNLSARSTKAAKETEELIQESLSRIAEGTDVSVQSLQEFSNIVVEIDKVTAYVERIATASKQQVASISQINSTINQINQTSLDNTSVAGESTEATVNLEQQARDLFQLVTSFKL